MGEVVAVATDRRLAHLTLSEDPFFHRLTPEKACEAVDFALNSGESAAGIVQKKWGRDPEQIAAALELPIFRNTDPAQTGKTVLFSEYGDKPPSIVLHSHSIAQANDLIREHGLADLLGIEDVGPVHLTHELYHHLDAEKLVPGTASIRIQTLTLGPIHLGSGLPSLSEIAADHFAKTVLGLKLPPKALTFITVYALNADYAWDLLWRLKAIPN
jgi:hypothetical protein